MQWKLNRAFLPTITYLQLVMDRVFKSWCSNVALTKKVSTYRIKLKREKSLFQLVSNLILVLISGKKNNA